MGDAHRWEASGGSAEIRSDQIRGGEKEEEGVMRERER